MTLLGDDIRRGGGSTDGQDAIGGPLVGGSAGAVGRPTRVLSRISSSARHGAARGWDFFACGMAVKAPPAPPKTNKEKWKMARTGP